MELIETFIQEAIQKGADDVVISEDDEIDAKTNTVKFVAVKR